MLLVLHTQYYTLGNSAIWLVCSLRLWLYVHHARHWILSKTKLLFKLGVLLKFQCKNFLKIKEYPSVDDSEAKKRLDGVWTVWFIVEWFTVADFLYARINVYHNRAKLTRLICHCFVHLGFPHKTNFACK